MKRPIVECLDFEDFVGRSDAVYKYTRGATTAQKFKRKALCIGLTMNPKINHCFIIQIPENNKTDESEIHTYCKNFATACPPISQPVHLGIGVFDGVHLGHQAIIESALSMAKNTGGKAGVLTFWPNPSVILNPTAAKPHILTLSKKLHYLSQTGIDFILVQPFDAACSEITAIEFLPLLKKQLPTLHSLHIGEDFQFGKGRQGNIPFLKNHSLGIDIQTCHQKKYGDLIISSSCIRNDLETGQLKHAIALLGRPYTYEGIVIKGDQRGRTLGFPTLNIPWDHTLCPRKGVYIVKARKQEQPWEHAVANLGLRPTIGDLKHPLLEVHILTPTDLTYGDNVEVQFEDFIRPEAQFKSLEDLTKAIKNDTQKAHDYFA